MPNKRVNIAVAGLGRMVNIPIDRFNGNADAVQGKRHVHTLVNRVPRANVVAVCSNVEHELSWAREEYKGSGIEVYTSYEEMLAHPKLNAVWISTSTDVHARQTLAGIDKGLHVLCEKPLSTDMEEVRHEWTGISFCICSRHWIASHEFWLKSI
jgi:myo-inositol 2-dehydrogenase / D-chiro-inositol 1-dehydrogenase